MKTDIIKVDSNLNGSDNAISAMEKFLVYHDISGKNAMHLNLLTEETISMIHGIMDDFSGFFHIESEETETGLVCRICVSVPKPVDCEQEMQFISVSSDGRNMNAKGIMGKIREFIRLTVQPPPKKERNAQSQLINAWWNTGVSRNSLTDTIVSDSAIWSLQTYRQNVSEQKEKNDEAWDELEKSIIANIADEVKVRLKADATEVIVEKIIRRN
ncbi:MAG: hypothetical protein IKS03_10635 [Ruminococcus sp.]|nr:hypothetical protein [Ruminococcus sp.]